MLRSLRDQARGQSLVEFSLTLIIFMVVLMGIFDLGRAIYMMNSTSEAAREIARVTIVHPYNTCCDLGSSTQAQAVANTQRGLIPGFQFTASSDVVCVDVTDTVVADDECRAGDHYVRVRVRAPYAPVTPLVSMFGTHTFESYSRVKIPSAVNTP